MRPILYKKLIALHFFILNVLLCSLTGTPLLYDAMIFQFKFKFRYYSQSLENIAYILPKDKRTSDKLPGLCGEVLLFAVNF